MIIRGPDEQGFVDRVLALHAEEMDAPETQLLIEGDRLGVIVHDRQVHVG